MGSDEGTGEILCPPLEEMDRANHDTQRNRPDPGQAIQIRKEDQIAMEENPRKREATDGYRQVLKLKPFSKQGLILPSQARQIGLGHHVQTCHQYPLQSILRHLEAARTELATVRSLLSPYWMSALLMEGFVEGDPKRICVEM